MLNKKIMVQFVVLMLALPISVTAEKVLSTIAFRKQDLTEEVMTANKIKFEGRAGIPEKGYSSLSGKSGKIYWSYSNLAPGKYDLLLRVGTGAARQVQLDALIDGKWQDVMNIESTKNYEEANVIYTFEVKSEASTYSLRLKSMGGSISYVHFATLVLKHLITADHNQLNTKIQNSKTAAVLRSTGDLTIELNPEGYIKSIVQNNVNISADDKLFLSGLNISTFDFQPKALRLVNTLEREQETIIQKFTAPEDQLHGKLIFTRHGDYIKVSGEVESSASADRGITLKYRLPIKADNLYWSGSLDKAERIDLKSAVTCDNSATFHPRDFLVDGAALGVKREKIAELYRHTKTFCSTVYNQKSSISLAISRDDYEMVDMYYNAVRQCYEISFVFGLSPDSKHPNKATFNFYITGLDANWGFRSALEKYYRTFPQYFEKRIPDEGGLFPFVSGPAIKTADEFVYSFNWSGNNKYCKAVDIHSFMYSIPGQLYINLGEKQNLDIDRSKVTDEEKMAALKRQFGKQGAEESICYNVNDKPIFAYTTYSDFQGTVNNDPVLPYGKYYLDYLINHSQNYSGVAYDGLLGGLNYRRSHIKVTDFNLLYNPSAKKCMIDNFFSCLELARAICENFSKSKKYIIANTIISNLLYGSPMLDIITSEGSINISPETMLLYRQYMFRKPISLLSKGFWSTTTQEQLEQYIKRCLAFGVFPGLIDKTPSSMHMFSNYWRNQRWYNRDRAMWRKYNQLIHTIAGAGWQAVPYARFIAKGDYYCERFGSFDKGAVFFSLYNGKDSASGKLEIDKKDLNISGKIEVLDEISNQILPFSEDAKKISIELKLEHNDTILVSINSPEAFKRRRIARALAWLESREKWRSLDRIYGNRLTKWPALRSFTPGTYTVTSQFARSGKQSLTNDESLFLEQGNQLLHKDKHDLKLGVWAKAQDASKASIIITTQYLNEIRKHSYTLTLDGGTYDWKYFSLEVPSAKALESVIVGVYYQGKGKVYLDDISLTCSKDEYKENLLRDGSFEEHFMSTTQWENLDQQMTELKGLLKTLQTKMTIAAADKVYAKMSMIVSWINGNSLQDQAARELRDIADIQRLLQVVFKKQTAEQTRF